jgi:hypothetical protein
MLSAERQYLGFDLAVQHAVRRLQGGDGVDCLHPLHLLHAEVGHAQVSDLPLFD